MATTKSWERTLSTKASSWRPQPPTERRREFWWLLATTLLVSTGLLLVLRAKTQDFTDEQAKLDKGEIIDLNALTVPAQLAPALRGFSDPREREIVTQKAWVFLTAHQPLPNVGALSRIRVDRNELTDLPSLARTLPATKPEETKPNETVGLLPLSKLKAQLAVRTPEQFLTTYRTWCLIYVGAFWLVHFAFRWRRFAGDSTILPALHLLTGIGLMLMVSLRDPLRDTLEFKKAAWGVAVGCLILLMPLFRGLNYRSLLRFVYLPLFAALGLLAALIVFGSGPTGSDAKVNLGPFQPVEVIKVLIVFFLAGYFAKRWEWLREAREKVLVPRGLRWLELPRFAHALPVMFAVAAALALFFVLKDLGPALVLGFVFLMLFALARGKWGLAFIGVMGLVGGVTLGYRMGAPHTVVERVTMWLSPWDNDIRGGDQLADALWGFSTGGLWGSGPGWGDPSVIPAGHTDLVLPAIGEEWGFLGVCTVCLLLAFLVRRAFRIGLRAPDEYGLFLSSGLGILLALEMLLISGGALGAIPLSGVVSPFLSSGNTAMLANFFIFAVLLSVSDQTARLEPDLAIREGDQVLNAPFGRPLQIASIALGLCAGALLARTAYLQILHDQELMIQEAHVITADRVKRIQRNPRLNLLAASIPRGDIFDRNGVLLATSRWETLEQHRGQLEALGVSVDQACSRLESRHYPFGPVTAHLLGDYRTGENFRAANTSFIEHDSSAQLQGYADFHELAPYLRYRHHRDNPALLALLNRDRSVHSTIDIRLQQKAAAILEGKLEASDKKGALVVMDSSSGDVLALVSWPEPDESEPATPDQLLDRARYGQYPPGSTFKLVTAMAALRLDPKATQKRYTCRGLGDGRVGTEIPGWRRPIRDDVGDHAHGTIDLAQAIAVSCNAYFAQLGVNAVGAKALYDTAQLVGIPAGDLADLKKMMPFAAYGQGTVVATPFKMARVSATIANNGQMPQGRWVSDQSNHRNGQPLAVITPEAATFLAHAMRSVVTSGTARSAMAGLPVSVAGKTGTAQLDEGQPHSWFTGFAPYDDTAGAPATHRIAFAIVVEHGGYGAKFAAPIGRDLVEAANGLGFFGETSSTLKPSASEPSSTNPAPTDPPAGAPAPVRAPAARPATKNSP
jgi:cell division protein FtsW (lipid II flippase)/cell division protein FtsI/penicillin-binding protein 2